jgi:hypothetical protein
VLALHDTTTMSFRPDGQREGLGRVRSTGQAFFAHVTLAVTSDTRTPLGVLAMRAHVLAHDRLLDTDEAPFARTLQAALSSTPPRLREVPLSKRPAASRSPRQKRIHPVRDGREAVLAYGATTLTLKRPVTPSKTLPANVQINIVRGWEPMPPEGETAVEWILVTREPIDDADAIARFVECCTTSVPSCRNIRRPATSC